MARLKRGNLAVESERAAARAALDFGGRIRRARLRRRLTLKALAARVGISTSRMGQIERGRGAEAPVSLWITIAAAAGLPLRIEVGRDIEEPVANTGHLQIQELVLRLGRRLGFRRTFELHTKPSDPSRSADVGLRDDARRILMLQECWNTFGDIGAASRSTVRKVAEAKAHGIAIAADGPPYAVRSVWIVRATRYNRAIIERYPEVFSARFPGSSYRWVKAQTEGAEPPEEPGLVWCDVAVTRLFPWRRNAGRER